MTDLPSRSSVTLGILAGGRASRLGGLDKAWMQRDGVAQVLRWRSRFAADVATILVSANRNLPRYRAAGFAVVADATAADLGPLAGLAALAGGCRTPWLLTIPVDLVDVGDGLLQALARGIPANGAGACASDDDGRQPLVALWRTDRLLQSAQAAIDAGEFAVHALQRRLDMASVRLPGVRLGNLNTPDELDAAGVQSIGEQP